MNNENTNLEPVQNNVDVLESEVTTPATDAPAFQTIDPTASFQTIDPTAVTEELTPSAPLTPEPVAEELTPVDSGTALPAAEPLTPTDPTAIQPSTEILNPEDSSKTTFDPTVAQPKASQVDMSSVELGNVRYNPVTGEEMDVRQAAGFKITTPEEESKKDDEKSKKEVDYKPPSTGSSIVLILFFIGLIAFVVFLPDIQNQIALYKSGGDTPEEIFTGKLVCTYSNSTVNLDHSYTREFVYTDKKLESAKFTTVIRGDATLDEEALDKFNEQCVQIHNNVEGIEGVIVNCDYIEGKLTETEKFDYATYNLETVSAAYTEAGGTVLEFQNEQDIDEIMTMMRQGGFDCNKKK